jgi:hypothetical protein
MSDPQKVTYLGKVDFRNKELPFGIKARDRTRHMYVIGKTGMGKSTLLENLAIQDINNGEGVCVIDPHGSMAEKLLDYIPESRIKDVVYFAPFDGDNPIGLNVLEKVTPDKRYLVANGIMAAFKKLFKDQFSARMEYILNNIILALLENDGQSLLGVNRMLTDKDYRKQIVSNVTDPTVKDFWEKEYANYTDRFAAEAAPAIQNKVGQFVANPLIRNIIGQQKTAFDIRELMDNKKILIVNLSKGKVGEGNANLIGSLLITKIYLAAMSRADVGPYELEKLPPFYFYVDEFQNFANESFASILSEARKYNLALTVAHQYVEQMEDEVKSAIFGNVGTMVVFRVGATDAEIFEKEFAPYFTMDDIVNLSAYQVYLRLMIDGVGSNPFSASMLPPIQKPAISYQEAVIAYTRTTYGKPRFVVEEEIKTFYAPVHKEPTPKSQAYEKTSSAPQQSSEYQPAHQKTFKRDSYQEKSTPRREESFQKNEQKNDQGVREERRLPIRKITDQTPLPPRRFESRRDESQKKEQSQDAYSASRDIEEQFHKAPHTNHKPFFEEQRSQQEPTLKKIETPTFDEKPAVSLKDALAKALSQRDDLPAEKPEQSDASQSTRKEVSEDVLRKLLED